MDLWLRRLGSAHSKGLGPRAEGIADGTNTHTHTPEADTALNYALALPGREVRSEFRTRRSDWLLLLPLRLDPNPTARQPPAWA